MSRLFFLRVFFLALLVFFGVNPTLVGGLGAHAQCDTCTPDESCGEGQNTPFFCPAALPDAIVGEAYEHVIHFYVPAQISDPDGGFEVDITAFEITGVAGLPFGLDITLNDSDGIYQIAEGQNHGCATICGTPLVPGVYEVTLSVLADITLFGIPQTFPQSFPLDFEVFPGQGGGNATFNFDGIAGCDSLLVNLEATIDAAPNPTTWAWDFGNGTTSDQQIPPAQLYDTPGSYVVSLTTEVLGYQISSVNLTQIGSGWAGDLDEPLEFFTDPDPYFVLQDADDNVLFTSSIIENVNAAEWSDLSIQVPTETANFLLYDSDQFSDDDLLVSISFTVSEGALQLDQSENLATVAVNQIALQSLYNEETFSVFPKPAAALTFDEAEDQLTLVGEGVNQGTWLHNGEQLEFGGTVLEGPEPGAYQVYPQNEFGCQGEPQSYTLCPSVMVFWDTPNSTVFTTQGFANYAWFLDGQIIPGNDWQTDYVGEGNYSVAITTEYDCTVISGETYVSIGVPEFDQAKLWNIFPNPAHNRIRVGNLSNENIQIWLQIKDLQGKILEEKAITTNHPIDISHLESGT